jgi:hypothetical protein
MCPTEGYSRTRNEKGTTMPLVDEHFSRLFANKVVVPAKLRDTGWSDQGSLNAHFGFPRKKGLWLLPMNPAFDSCEPIKLYVLLHLAG